MKLKMNPIWSIIFLIIAYFDIKKIITGYDLQQSLCGPGLQPSTGLTEVTCMGSTYQLSIFHLIVVLFTLVVFNVVETEFDTKLIMVMIYGLTVSIVLGGMLFIPAIVVYICIQYIRRTN